MVEISVSGVTGGRWKRAVVRIEAPDAVVGKQRLPEPQYRANAPTQVIFDVHGNGNDTVGVIVPH
jgi:hypothetical protein